MKNGGLLTLIYRSCARRSDRLLSVNDTRDPGHVPGFSFARDKLTTKNVAQGVSRH